MVYQRNGGGRNSGGRGQKQGAEYVYSSSLKVNLCADKADKEPLSMVDFLGIMSDEFKGEFNSLETNITLTAEKAQQFLEVLQAAIDDPQGDGGIRISVYTKEGENPKTGEVFDSASIMILGKFPNQNKGNRRGGGSFRGNAGGGRKDYGSQDQDQRSNNRGNEGDSPSENRRGAGRSNGNKTARGTQQQGEEGGEGNGVDSAQSRSQSRGKGNQSRATAQGRSSRQQREENYDNNEETNEQGEEEYEEVKSPYKKGGKKQEEYGQDDIPY